VDLKPLGDRVLVKPDELSEEHASGLIVKRNWQPSQSGTVVAVGETTCQHCKAVRPTDVHVGDWVLFSWQVGQELSIDDGNERYLIIPIRDLLAVEPKEAA
jgi:chaperonin GroES